MPTLLEKPVPATPTTMPSEVLHYRHRWEKWRGALIALVLGLSLTLGALLVVHHSWHAPENWSHIEDVWACGLSATLIAALFARRFGPTSLMSTAQKVDQHLGAKNRLETSVTLHESQSALALAQRDEAARYLKSAPPVKGFRALKWLSVGLFVLILTHFAMLGTWLFPSLLFPAKPQTPKPPPAAVLPQASIVWKSPEPESKANPIEEVPTVALAQSTTGLKNLSLEMSVNGVPKKSVPLPAQPYDKAGKNILKSSLYMDELGAQPFDVVSYYIKGQRLTDQKVPDTTSAIQFVQIRPFRDDVTQVHGGEGGNPQYALLIRLKLAELRSIKENFVLAHTDLPATNPVRMKENDRVGKNQGDLSAKTEEVVQAFILKGYPADIIDLLRQAEPPMDDASKKILATQNTEALPAQEKALGLIVEVEKFFIKVMADKGKGGPPDHNPDDPFKDKQKHELKKRMDAAAGQLEQLARNQTKLAQDIDHGDASSGTNPSPAPAPQPGAGKPGNQGSTPTPGTPEGAPGDTGKSIPLPPGQSVDPAGPDAEKGTLAERQTRVAQGIDALLNTNTVLPPGANDALQAAQKDAVDSMHQLNQGDEAGAREPAAKAAQDLQRAVAEMNKAGEQQTKLAMEEAQQKMNDLAKQMDDLAKNGSPDAGQKLNDLAQQIDKLQQQIQAAADQQQEAGSAPGAQHLEKLARALADQKVPADLAGMSKTGLDPAKLSADAQKLEALAGMAAQGQTTTPGKPSAQDLARLVNDMEATRANLARLAEKAAAGQEALGPQTPEGDGAKPGASPQAGAGASPEPQPGQGEGQNPTPTPAAGKGQGKDQGKGEGQSPTPTSGQGTGKSKEAGQGQGQQPGDDPVPGQGQGQPKAAGTGPNGDAPNGTGSGSQVLSGGLGGSSASQDQTTNQTSPAGGVTHDVAGPMTAGTAQAYREAIVDLKDEAQRADVTNPNADTSALLQSVKRVTGATDFRDLSAVTVVRGYQTVASPLDKLIRELEQAASHAQREETVKQPNLDDAPASYRSAVSDYFETMSRDYHPDIPDQDPKKP